MPTFPVDINGQTRNIEAADPQMAVREAYRQYQQERLKGSGAPAPSEQEGFYGPPGHPYAEGSYLARQGKMPSGEPIPDMGQATREAAGNVVRLGSGLVKIPAMGPPVGGPLASGAVGAGGELLAQLIAGEPVDWSAVAMGGALPFAGSAALRTGERAAAGVAPKLPGASRVMQEEGVQEARGIPGKYQPQMPPGSPAARRPGMSVSAQYYDQIAGVNPRVPLKHVVNAANDVLTNEYLLANVPKGVPTPLVSGKLKDIAEYINGVVQQDQGQVQFKTIRAIQQRLGALINSASGEEADALKGALKHIDRGLFQDLEDAANTVVPATKYPGSATRAAGILKKANNAYRRERAVQDLSDLIESGVAKGRNDLEMSFNPAKPLNALDEARRAPLGTDKYKYLRESFTPDEITEIQKSLLDLKGLPSLPPPGGEGAFGSGRVNPRALMGFTGGGATGAGLARVLGLDPAMAGILAGVGSAAGTAAMTYGRDALARAIATPGGRKMLKTLLASRAGKLDDRALRVLASSTRVGATGSPEEDAGVNEEDQTRGQ
jgi:hypothetical protein